MVLGGNLPILIGNVLSDRTFQVHLGTILSDKIFHQKGVPRGAILSPFIHCYNKNIAKQVDPGIDFVIMDKYSTIDAKQMENTTYYQQVREMDLLLKHHWLR